LLWLLLVRAVVVLVVVLVVLVLSALTARRQDTRWRGAGSCTPALTVVGHMGTGYVPNANANRIRTILVTPLRSITVSSLTAVLNVRIHMNRFV
jgi:hypothetical protein